MTSNQRPVRSALFVPGSRPERFDKAFATGANSIIVDFEDAVEEELKAQARKNLASYLNDRPEARVVVRINAVGHPQHHEDLDFCQSVVGVGAVMLPKTESPEQLLGLSFLEKPLWPLLESARGIREVDAIAQVSGVERLTFGALDLGFELGLRAGSPAAQKIMDQVRYQMILASTNAGLAKPMDTVFADIANLVGLRQMAEEGRDMGFAGMLCIHPSQVAVANEVYSPTEAEIEWAEKVIAAAKTQSAGAFRLEGRMVDAPVIRQARQLINDLANA
ncbi:CoA ester lyase [Pseudomonas syringae pv. actinidifoliorum]|nr:CoA ester lyase [Pseudomonas syringae pv. actinidifoliorum]NAT58724.1 CoA ester lyase [Pseudomonas syringae pv. actinidifoliorum]